MRDSGRLTALMLSDDLRGGIPIGIATVVAVVLAVAFPGKDEAAWLQGVVLTACIAYTFAFLVYLVWTHMVYTRMDPRGARAVARAQFSQKPSRWVIFFSFGSAEGWSVAAAMIAFIGSLAASVYGISGGGVGVTVVALAMAATAWAMVAYTYALRYFRINSADQSFRFDFDGEPDFADFLSFALMVSSAGSHVAATPTTRIGVRAMRSHTVIAFVFNALVIAVTVSLITNLVASYGA